MVIVEYDKVTDKLTNKSKMVKDRYFDVVDILTLSSDCKVNRFKDHQLKGRLKHLRELHLDDDCLLVYKRVGDEAHLVDLLTHKQLDKFEGELEWNEFEFCNNILKL